MKRWLGIRHLRYWYWQYRFNRWWLRVGRYYWLTTNPSDEAYLEAIWKGEA